MDETQQQRWIGRPKVARAVRVLSYLVPLVASIGAAFVLSSILPPAPSITLGLVRWAGIAAVSTVVLVLTDRLARRILPLSALLNLTLVFPDQAPSRFRLAIRSGTTRQLARRLREAKSGELGRTPNEAAVRLLELVGMLAIHDRLTRGHSERVRAYTQMIGQEMGITGDELDRMHWAGLLHDVGKLTIDPAILNKPGRLTDEEFEIIKTHPDEGRKLVEPLVDWLGDAARAVWEHHERFDGGGYPAGLAGSEISLAARIVAVGDAYDVMTSYRSYKRPMSSAAARAELARCAGSQFDPDVVRAFLSISLGRLRIAMGPFSWLMQLALFPQVAAAQAAGSVAAGTAVAVGAAAGTIGMAAAPTVDADEAVPLSTAPVVAVVEETGGWTAIDAVLRGELGGAASAVAEAPIPAPPIAVPDEPVAPVTALPSLTPEPEPEAEPEPEPDDGTAEPIAPEPAAPPAPPPTVPPSTTVAPATTVPPSTTVPPATTVPPSAATATTAAPATTFSLKRLYLMPSGPGDTISQSELPLSTSEPPDVALFNYDTDRDGEPGLVVDAGDGGLGTKVSTEIQRFGYTATEPTLVRGDVSVRLLVSVKDFEDDDAVVRAGFYRCASTCELLGAGRVVASKPKPYSNAKIDIGAVDVLLQPGERIELRLIALGDEDVLFAFGTKKYDSRIDIDED